LYGIKLRTLLWSRRTTTNVYIEVYMGSERGVAVKDVPLIEKSTLVPPLVEIGM